MADKNIKIAVVERRAIVEGSPTIVCGNSGYTVTFTFDDEWNLTGARTARFVYFKDGVVQHEDVVFSGNVVAVPILSNVAFVKVGVFAGELCTTTPARINCEASILCGSGAVHEPTPDVYDQIMTLFNEMAEAGAFGATEEQAQQIADNAADIQALLDGVLPAGDSNKLGGKGASEYALKSQLFSNVKDYSNLDFDITVKTGIYGGGNIPSQSGATNYPTDTTGVLIVIAGYSTIYQTYVTYGGSVYERAKYSAFNYWSEWKKTATAADLANYFKNTGGVISGDIRIRYADNGYALLLKNNSVTADYGTEIKDYTSNGAVMRLRLCAQDKRFDVVDTAGKAYDILHTGNMHNYLLLLTAGGTQEIKAPASVPLTVNNTYEHSTGVSVGYSLRGVELGRIGFEGANNPVFIDTAKTMKPLHHDGNSAKVAFTESDTEAPSDTTALWAHL